MKTISESLQREIGRLREGSESAATTIHDRIARNLAGYARRFLPLKMAHRVDGEDVRQDALCSLFTRLRDGRLDAETWEELKAKLFIITQRKAISSVRTHEADKRNYRQTRHTGEAITFAIPGSREASPPEAAWEAELSDILAGLRPELLEGFTEQEREIIRRLFDFKPPKVIAGELGLSQAKVRRILALFYQRLDE